MNTYPIEFHQQLIADIIRIMNDEELYWKKEWVVTQRNLLTNHIYTGNNAIELSITAYIRDYKDCRWMTLNQMQRNRYEFKKPESVRTEGVTILLVQYEDKFKEKRFNPNAEPYKSLDDTKKLWYRTNYVTVHFIPYKVYNCSLIDGVLPIQSMSIDSNARNQKIEELISEPFVPIYYDGYDRAFYRIEEDKVHLPLRDTFNSLSAFYGTAMHELAHATGHQSRLQREIRNYFGDEGYAYEELVAEFSSILLQLEYGCVLSQEHIKNHAAYLQSWKKYAKEDPFILPNALSDANSAVNYIKKQYEQENSFYNEKKTAILQKINN
jgi:antirestriction protein ArdC